ncbi:DHH family phosphoesterase [Clostridium felsineum]|uniref:Cyclic-di-AMP phosphodiesterase n=1 Tax=Clostridium felsineum TaxID=36839 RepID=A0A1S8LY71_9CLOT|nr:DHH family phosphoesterase [Clostridium felsineum]MCR3761141.1 DHH family phosphoesterase [Clostridium felsineum]URZ02797.1 Cyclic-di-AMP phosphodiesterase GdpP [Clostridium felsineum]URZ08877.1 Cyclic-di-AMP phosphodiesterase GdpP [Clostridium felsineum]URZ09505.1 Cyclic-di-AMP phosphodiesterase GdpP [Clostridium felsineum]
MKKKYKGFYNQNSSYIFISLVLIVLMLAYGHYKEGIVAAIILLFFILYDVEKVRLKKDEWKNFIEDFSSSSDIAARNILINLPFPVIIASEKGNILWYNQSISNVFNDDILGNNLESLVQDKNLSNLLEKNSKPCKNFKIKEKYYDIYSSTMKIFEKNKEIFLIYFYDVTDKHEFEEEVSNCKTSVLLIEVDNLDEVIKSTPEDKKPLLKAQIETAINTYAKNISAMFKKYSTGKYVLVLQNKRLKLEAQKKFEILDQIREIDMGNSLAVTLSIGIGKSGKTPIENYNYAVLAKELALGRGGDQVVIKDGEQLLFYGGNTKEVEKRTKVRARVIGQSLMELVKESSNVFIMGHINPDIDCIGGAIGLYSVLSSKVEGKVHIVLDEANSSVKGIVDRLVENYDEYKDVFIKSSDCFELIDTSSLLILDDVNSRNYVLNEKILEEINKIVVIDHHRRAVNYIKDTILSYIESYASSTSELVTEMIQYMNENHKLKPIEAEALLAGIVVDTKHFSFKTGVRTFEAAAFLRKNGADTIEIKKLFSNDLENYIKKSEIIKSARIVHDNIAIAVCPKEIDSNIMAAQAADELLNITGMKASFVLVKIKNNILISGRSFGDINVQIVLEALGGGGHITMAGAKIKASSVDDVLNNLVNAIDKYLEEGE